jgi:hypothetical protein
MLLSNLYCNSMRRLSLLSLKQLPKSCHSYHSGNYEDFRSSEQRSNIFHIIPHILSSFVMSLNLSYFSVVFPNPLYTFFFYYGQSHPLPHLSVFIPFFHLGSQDYIRVTYIALLTFVYMLVSSIQNSIRLGTRSVFLCFLKIYLYA